MIWRAIQCSKKLIPGCDSFILIKMGKMLYFIEPQAHYDQLPRYRYCSLEVSGAEGLSDVSVAPLGDDKKIVLHRIFLKLSGP